MAFGTEGEIRGEDVLLRGEACVVDVAVARGRQKINRNRRRLPVSLLRVYVSVRDPSREQRKRVEERQGVGERARGGKMDGDKGQGRRGMMGRLGGGGREAGANTCFPHGAKDVGEGQAFGHDGLLCLGSALGPLAARRKGGERARGVAQRQGEVGPDGGMFVLRGWCLAAVELGRWEVASTLGVAARAAVWTRGHGRHREASLPLLERLGRGPWLRRGGSS